MNRKRCFVCIVIFFFLSGIIWSHDGCLDRDDKGSDEYVLAPYSGDHVFGEKAVMEEVAVTDVDVEETGYTNSEDTRHPNFAAINDVKDEMESFSLAPPRKNKRILQVAGVVLLTGILLKNDRTIFNRTNAYAEKNPWIGNVSSNVTLLGDNRVNLGIVGAFYISGLLFKDQRASETAQLVLNSFLRANIAGQLLKRVAGRQRPELSVDPDNWGGLESGLASKSYRSFPSGHTITAWSTATVIAHQYRHKRWVPILSYSLATMVGVSRITERKHWFSDVFVGAVLGYIIGRYTVKHRSGVLNILPTISGKHISLNVDFRLK